MGATGAVTSALYTGLIRCCYNLDCFLQDCEDVGSRSPQSVLRPGMGASFESSDCSDSEDPGMWPFSAFCAALDASPAGCMCRGVAYFDAAAILT